MVYEEIITALEEMKPHFDAGFTLSERSLLDELHHELFNRVITLTGCSDCYRDAYLIIYNKLKRDGSMPDKSNYKLKPGALIRFFGETEYYTNNVPDAVAERYLKLDKDNIKNFQRFPDDWESRIGAKKPSTEVKTEEEDNNTPAPQKTQQSARKPRSRKA